MGDILKSISDSMNDESSLKEVTKASINKGVPISTVDTKDDPANGWMVICMSLGKYIHAYTRKTLGGIIFDLHKEAESKFPGYTTPIQVFELGRQVNVRLDVDVVVKDIQVIT